MAEHPRSDRSVRAVADPPFARPAILVPPADISQEIARIARLQYGVISREQLVRAGLSSSAISRRVDRGNLHRVIDGVYSVGHARLAREGRWSAALLFTGPCGCLSHRTAAIAWGFDHGAGKVEVIRGFTRNEPRYANTKDPWLLVHRTRSMPDEELSRHKGFPLTSVARTLVDLAPRSTERQLKSFLTKADRIGVADRRQIADVLIRCSGWRGIGRLRDVVDQWDPKVAVTRSDLEALFLEVRRRHGIPQHEVNVMIDEFEVDCLWRESRTVVELDTFAHHGDELAFERDRERDLALETMGFHVLRVTHRMLVKDDSGVANTLKGLLRRH